MKLEIKEIAFVFMGEFKPIIFNPEWFIESRILPETDLIKKQNFIYVNENHTQLQSQWLLFDCSNTRLYATTNMLYGEEMLKNFVISTFSKLELEADKFGINIHFDYQCKNRDEWNKIGHEFAPKKLWNKNINDPGLICLEISGKKDEDDPLPGNIFFRINPSESFNIDNNEFGVSIRYTDHIELNETKLNIKEIIQDHFDRILKTAMSKSINLLSGAI